MTEPNVIDVDEVLWSRIKESALQSKWIPEDYFMNDWVSDVCNYLIHGLSHAQINQDNESISRGYTPKCSGLDLYINKKENESMTGKKNDQDNYEKVDYSLIPLDIIKHYLNKKLYGNAPGMDIAENKHFQLFSVIHPLIGHPQATADQIGIIFRHAVSIYGVKSLAASLGMGLEKYKERDNWKKFDSNPERFLKATLRHLMALIKGERYDGEKIEGYNKGNDHRGAVCFSLMVANHIIKKQREANELL